jgi:hypothetical protein
VLITRTSMNLYIILLKTRQIRSKWPSTISDRHDRAPPALLSPHDRGPDRLRSRLTASEGHDRHHERRCTGEKRQREERTPGPPENRRCSRNSTFCLCTQLTRGTGSSNPLRSTGESLSSHFCDWRHSLSVLEVTHLDRHGPECQAGQRAQAPVLSPPMSAEQCIALLF